MVCSISHGGWDITGCLHIYKCQWYLMEIRNENQTWKLEMEWHTLGLEMGQNCWKCLWSKVINCLCTSSRAHFLRLIAKLRKYRTFKGQEKLEPGTLLEKCPFYSPTLPPMRMHDWHDLPTKQQHKNKARLNWFSLQRPEWERNFHSSKRSDFRPSKQKWSQWFNLQVNVYQIWSGK